MSSLRFSLFVFSFWAWIVREWQGNNRKRLIVLVPWFSRISSLFYLFVFEIISMNRWILLLSRKSNKLEIHGYLSIYDFYDMLKATASTTGYLSNTHVYEKIHIYLNNYSKHSAAYAWSRGPKKRYSLVKRTRIYTNLFDLYLHHYVLTILSSDVLIQWTLYVVYLVKTVWNRGKSIEIKK